MRCKDSETCEGGENLQRNKDTDNFMQRPKHSEAVRRDTRRRLTNAVPNIRVRAAYREQGPLPQIQRLRNTTLHVQAAPSFGLLPFQGNYAPRCQAFEHRG